MNIFRRLRSRLFRLDPPWPWWLLAGLVTLLSAVAIGLQMWKMGM